MVAVASASQIHDIISSRFPFSVEKRRFPGSKYYGLFRTDTGDEVGAPVSEHYQPHQTRDVADFVSEIAAELNLGDEIRLTTSFYGNAHRVILAPSDSWRQKVAGEPNGLWPRIVVTAGYDRTAWSSTVGLFRDRCRNLMLLQAIDATRLWAKHTSSLQTRIADHQSRAAAIGESIAAQAAVADQLSGQRLRLDELMQEVFPVEGQPTPRQRRRMDQIVARAAGEIGGNPLSGPINAWLGFNAVQGWIQHERTRRGRLSIVDRALAGLEDADAPRALQAALALAS